MPIENVRLKSGVEYPVSPAYREAALNASVEDWAITFDGSVDTPDGGITLASLSTTMPMYRFTNDVLTEAQLQLLTMKAQGNALNFDLIFAQFNSVAWENVMSADINTITSLLLSIISGSSVSVNLSGLVANGAVLDGDLMCVAIAFESAGAWQDSTLGITVNVSQAGTYLLMCTPNTVSCVINGTISSAKYMFDNRYFQGQIVSIISGLIYSLLQTQLQSGSPLNLTYYPNVLAKLKFAGEHAVPIIFGHCGASIIFSNFQRTTDESGGIYSVSHYIWLSEYFRLDFNIVLNTLSFATIA